MKLAWSSYDSCLITVRDGDDTRTDFKGFSLPSNYIFLPHNANHFQGKETFLEAIPSSQTLLIMKHDFLRANATLEIIDTSKNNKLIMEFENASSKFSLRSLPSATRFSRE